MAMKHRGFTLIELLVVVAMIAIILGALTTSVAAAQNRARIQKATSDVKVITQAILAYENYDTGNGKYELKELGGYGGAGADCDSSSLGFLLGEGGTTKSGEKMPVMLMAALKAGKAMVDPWGTAYKVHIQQGTVPQADRLKSLKTGYYLPNFYRISKKERGL